MKSLRDGLTILLKYEPKGTSSAEHDIIYAGGDVCNSKENFSVKDIKALEELGWFWDDQFECWTMFT